MNIIKRIKLKLKHIYLININKYLNKKNYDKKIALISNNKYKNNVLDDLLIQNALLKNKVNCDIVSWEESINYNIYNKCLITSIWGYEKNIDQFEKWLQFIKDNNINVVNNIDIINNNYKKRIQIELLNKYNIPTIDTTIVDMNTKDISSFIKDNNEYVIKPCISAGGNNTYIITKEDHPNRININEINDKFKNIITKSDLMIQPFIKEIDNGEISLIYINKQYSHSIIRYPGILNNKVGVYENNIIFDDELNSIIKKIHNIEEYNDYTYMRIDLVKINNHYKVMELELLEPSLFFNKISNKNEQKEKIQLLVNSLTK